MGPKYLFNQLNGLISIGLALSRKRGCFLAYSFIYLDELNENTCCMGI